MTYDAKQAVYLPVADFLNLEFHLMDTRPGVKPDVFVTELVKRWLAGEMKRRAPRENGGLTRGFQWKNVFLPDGTCLRTSYHHTTEFAKVVGDRILSDDGLSMTPSLFVNRHAKDATHGASSGCVFLGMITGSVPSIAGRGLRKD